MNKAAKTEAFLTQRLAQILHVHSNVFQVELAKKLMFVQLIVNYTQCEFLQQLRCGWSERGRDAIGREAVT